jgi:hypothetical protein
MWKQMMLVSLFMGCVDKQIDSTNVNEDVEDSTLIEDTSMDQYKMVYCEEYAMRCDVYPSVEDCEAEFDTWFSDDCVIADKESFDACADWLFSLDCSTEGWIAECDEFYVCPD